MEYKKEEPVLFAALIFGSKYKLFELFRSKKFLRIKEISFDSVKFLWFKALVFSDEKCSFNHFIKPKKFVFLILRNFLDSRKWFFIPIKIFL